MEEKEDVREKATHRTGKNSFRAAHSLTVFEAEKLPEIVVCCGTGRIGREVRFQKQKREQEIFKEKRKNVNCRFFSQVVKQLVATQRFRVSVITRDPTKAAAAEVERYGTRLIKADLMKLEELKDAFAGVHGVFAMTPSVKDELKMAQNIHQAAAHNHVTHVVLLSMIGAEHKASWPAAQTKFKIEKVRETPTPPPPPKKTKFRNLRICLFCAVVERVGCALHYRTSWQVLRRV